MAGIYRVLGFAVAPETVKQGNERDRVEGTGSRGVSLRSSKHVAQDGVCDVTL